ncbi:alpha/beta fold hydrolase [Acidovorax cavernicola]|uniref:Alpha/beta fold hydrolase n=1 Tax=Acidovorax cavernicola TaxID=1675792 RepID=A0A9X8D7H6_9BURK|nr:alpha/beta fold hydrolase [Acidovorax cavernicola]RIX83604.1 alpha/beta fold hydrolase [Acidovorax cavernicola]
MKAIIRAAALSAAACLGAALCAQAATIQQLSTQSPVADPLVSGAASTTGTKVAFTLFLPDTQPEGGYPLVLHASGFGLGRLQAMPPNDTDPGANYWTRLDRLVPTLVSRGYAVISFDHRGHGDSGGDSRIMDPQAEIADIRSLIDWAERELPLRKGADGKPRIGSIGGSYGGGYQMQLAQREPRITTVIPSMTWYDLQHALAPQGVLKQGFVQFECFMAQRGKVRDGGLLRPLCEQAPKPGAWAWSDLGADAPRLRDAYQTHGPSGASWAGQPMRRVDALVVQASEDVLFDMGDGLRNWRQLASGGGDVRLMVLRAGHVNPRAGQRDKPARCGDLDAMDTMARWLDAKLRDETAGLSSVPATCVALDDGTAYRGAMPIALNASAALPRTEVPAGTAAPRFVALASVPAGAVLAGVPEAELDVQGQAGPGVALVGLALRKRGGEVALLSDQVVPVPTGRQRVALGGVAARVQPGDELGVALFATHPQYVWAPASGAPAAGITAVNAYAVSGRVWLPLAADAAPQ